MKSSSFATLPAATPAPPAWRAPWWGPLTGRARLSAAGWRDGILFLTGLSLIVYEAVGYQGPERWHLVMLYAGMVGLPVFLRSDERHAGGPTPTQKEPGEVVE